MHGRRGIDGRVIKRRGLGDAGQQRVLAEAQVVQRRLEVGAGGGADPAATQGCSDLAQVVRHDLRLGGDPLPLPGAPGFAHLAVSSVVAGEGPDFVKALTGRGSAVARASTWKVINN